MKVKVWTGSTKTRDEWAVGRGIRVEGVGGFRYPTGVLTLSNSISEARGFLSPRSHCK